jgi:hypothetical protein
MSAFFNGETFATNSEGITHLVPKPSWRYVEGDDPYSLSLEAFWDEVRPKFWEIEEEILTTTVVELLRSKGYTVIEPGYRTL